MKAVLVALGLTLVASPAWAWGASGHRMLTEAAVQSLPAAIPQFLRTHKAVAELGELAREPDRAKDSGQPYDHDWSPGHYVDVTQSLTVAAPKGPSLKNLPSNREAYDTALRAVGMDEYKVGYLPYSIIDGWEKLVDDFAYWRADVAAEKSVKSQRERRWFASDQALRQMLTLRDLGVWSHFVGDGSQPMHVSVHYNGWGHYPNPEGFTQDKIHAHFEGTFVRANVTEPEVRKAMKPPKTLSGGIFAETSQYLATTEEQIVPLYRMQKAGDFRDHNAVGKTFVIARLAAASDEVRDLVVEAWHASATAKVGYPPVKVTDVDSSKADTYTAMRGAD